MRTLSCTVLALLCAAAPLTGHAQSVPPTAGVDSVAHAIRAQVGGRLKAFYAPRGYWPLWIRGGSLSPAATRFLELVGTADLDGLDPRDYDVDELHEAVAAAQTGSPDALARAEIRLSRAFARYVRDMRAPSIRMAYLDRELEPERLREDEVLRRAALADSFADYVDRLGWMSPHYVGLREALGRYRSRWETLPYVPIPSGPPLRQGAKGERVRLLRERFGLPEGAVFDKALAGAVRAFQADHGLETEGIVGGRTIAALNRDPAEYERILRLNLERARVLPGPWTRHVVVNAAAARLWYYGDGKEQGTMRVVVGAPETPTPMLAGMVRYATLNPYWNVPADLARKRIAPRILQGASLNALRYEALSDWSANARTVDPATIDWQAVAAGAQEVRLRQLPGKTNAMGRVKFMFPNDLGIYLHDTPDRALFTKEARQFSNGCVRLEDAPRLGTWFFGVPLTTSSDEPEQHRPLPEPVPVYLTYLTAVATDGGVRFLNDVYGRDAEALRQTAAR